jgi:hypothetical protein
MESRVKADQPGKLDTRCEVDVDKLFAAQSGRRKKIQTCQAILE